MSFSKDIRYKLINKLTKNDELIVSNGTYNPLDFPIPEGYYRLDADPCKARTITRERERENNNRLVTFIYFNRITFDKNTGIWSEPTEKEALYIQRNNFFMIMKRNEEVKDPQYWGD